MEQRTVPEAESHRGQRPSNVNLGRRLAVGAATLAFAVGAGGVAGCGDDDEGPAEEAGQAIDDAGEEAGKELEEADQEVGDDEK